MSSKIDYHNLQIDGDLLHKEPANGEEGVCNLVMQAYHRGMEEKRRCGLQSRLYNAYKYLCRERYTHMIINPKHDDYADDDCDDCDQGFQVNLDYIRLQHDTAMSIYIDALKGRGDDIVTISPTPKPDSSSQTKARVKKSVMDVLLRDISFSVAQRATSDEEAEYLTIILMEQLLGTQDGRLQIQDLISRQKKLENIQLFAEASRKAENAVKHVNDKLVEAEFLDIMEEEASYAFWYDYSVVRGPVMIEKECTKINSKGRLVEDFVKVWDMEVIHPLNHFFSETTTFDEMGDFEGDVTWLSRSDLDAISSLKGGAQKSVKDVLGDFISYQTFSGDFEHKDDYDSGTWAYNDRIPVIRIVIKLDTDQAKDAFKDASIRKNQSSHMAEIWCTRDKVLYKSLYPRHQSFNSYRKNAFNIVDRSEIASAAGLYSICRTAQELIDNSMLKMFDNLENLNEYILEVNISKLDNADELEEDLEETRPIIKTRGIAQYSQFGGNDKALYMTAIPDNINTFTQTLLLGIDQMQQLGFSAFALGQGNFAGVRSAGQTAILQGNLFKRFVKFLSQQESFIESPIAKYIWISEAIKDKKGEIVVDGKVSVKSYSGFLEKQNKADEIGFMLQSVSTYMANRAQLISLGQDPAFFDGLLKQFVEASGFNPEGLGVTPDEIDIGGIGQVDDLSSEPLQNLDGRSNVPSDVQNVIPGLT